MTFWILRPGVRKSAHPWLCSSRSSGAAGPRHVAASSDAACRVATRSAVEGLAEQNGL